MADELVGADDLKRHFCHRPKTPTALKEWLEDAWRSRHLINPQRLAALGWDDRVPRKFKFRWIGRGYA
jgi:hypothetical protein